MNYFLVLGYGIPKDISTDENYGIYLKTVFNRIFDHCMKTGDWSATIVFTGGRTDMFKPYRRTEAGEMTKVFRMLARRPVVKKRTRSWKFVAEKNALSTLDNFLLTKRYLKGMVRVFGESSRGKRIAVLAKKILKRANIETIDFDQSANRYLDSKLLQEKEARAMKWDLWSLRSPEHLAYHRKLFKRKFEFLRKAGPENHVQALEQWWRKMKEFENDDILSP